VNAPTPGSAEWLRIVTASKVAAILGVSPWESPYSIWHRMRGELPPVEVTEAMKRGNFLEAGVLAWWQDRHPEFPDCTPQYWATRDDLLWAAATPDLRAIGRRADGPEIVVVDAKTASHADDWGTPGTDEIPTHYLTSTYWQLAMTPDATRAYVVLLGPFLEFSEYVVERDEAIQDDLIARCAKFYDSLSGNVPPDLDDTVATFDTLKAMNPDIDKGERAEIPADVAVEYVTAITDAKAATAREVGAKSALLAHMGDAQYATANGVRIARRQPNKYGVSLIATATPADLTGDPS
jgi:putative phage-type endonuclease